MIEAMIGEGDERLMAAAIMPLQRVHRHPGQALTFVQHAVEVRGRFVLKEVLVHLITLTVDALEEVGRRQLLAVTGYDKLPATVDRPDGIFGKNLGGLVEDHEIELELFRWQKLAHRQRAHAETGLQLQEQVGHALEETAHGPMSASLCGFPAEEADFRILRLGSDRPGTSGGTRRDYTLGRQLDQLAIDRLEFVDYLFVVASAEFFEFRIVFHHDRGPGLIDRLRENPSKLIRRWESLLELV